MTEWNPHVQSHRDSHQSVDCGILDPVLPNLTFFFFSREACNLGFQCWQSAYGI